MTQSRDFITIGPIQVRHSTAVRDWLCGCGSPLITYFYNDAPGNPGGWRTVCHAEPIHDDQKFVHKSAYEHIEHRELMDAAQAQDVFEHLPPELQAAIAAEGGRHAHQESDQPPAPIP